MKSTLVVGGDQNLLDRSLRPLLAEYGLRVDYLFDMDVFKSGRAKNIPAGVEVVVVLADLLPRGHYLTPEYRKMAEKMGVAFVGTSRKKAQMQQDLRTTGFHPVVSTGFEGGTPTPFPKAAPPVPIVNAVVNGEQEEKEVMAATDKFDDVLAVKDVKASVTWWTREERMQVLKWILLAEREDGLAAFALRESGEIEVKRRVVTTTTESLE